MSGWNFSAVQPQEGFLEQVVGQVESTHDSDQISAHGGSVVAHPTSEPVTGCFTRRRFPISVCCVEYDVFRRHAVILTEGRCGLLQQDVAVFLTIMGRGAEAQMIWRLKVGARFDTVVASSCPAADLGQSPPIGETE